MHFKQVTLKLFLQTRDFFRLQCTVMARMTIPCYTVPDPESPEDVYLQLFLPQHLLSLWLAVTVAHGCFCEKMKIINSRNLSTYMTSLFQNTGKLVHLTFSLKSSGFQNSGVLTHLKI